MSDGNDYVGNDYRDPDPKTNISTGAGEDYIWTHLFLPTLTVDGGSGFDIFVIPDGWWGNFDIQETNSGYTIVHKPDGDTIHVTNVELIIFDTFSQRVEIFDDPFLDANGNYVVDWNNLTDTQRGLFTGAGWLGTSRTNYYPSLYNSGDGDDIVHLPHSANYVIFDDAYDPADVIWNYGMSFYAGDGEDSIYGGNYHDIIHGGPGDDNLWGGAGNDVIRDDPFSGIFESVGGWIDGGAGTDTVVLQYPPTRIVTETGTVLWTQGGPASINLNGQKVFAEYRDAAGDLVGSIEIINVEKIDGLYIATVPSAQLFNDYANIVNFTVLGEHEKGAIDSLKQESQLSQMYRALGGDDVVTLAANGTRVGSATWDSSITFDAGMGQDRIDGSAGADKIDGAGDDDRLDGKAGADLLIGNYGNDLLIGGAGADDMQGGYGDDVYEVDNAGDAPTEQDFAGIDLVKASVDHTLNPYFENLTLTGTAALTATGNGIANTLQGNSGNNKLFGLGGDDVLDGGTGVDILEGGLGADTYYVTSLDDQIIEVGSDVDHVRSRLSYVLADLLENLTLEGVGALNGTGNDLANTLTGNAGANILNGMAGADRMVGGAGADQYHVDILGDVVVEIAGGGIDTVRSDIDYVLGAEVENLILKGSLGLNGTGNTAANDITGNGGANILDGGEGADILRGRYGNDTYVVDHAGDKVIEDAAGAGTDTVRSSVTFTLGLNVENLTLSGTAAIDGKGNGLGNLITGNSAKNVLNGLAGADTMDGADGDDTYIVDHAGDQAVETNFAGGTDTVRSSVSFGLGSNIEALVLTGTAAIDGLGNELANTLVGNAAANRLDGGIGGDQMSGGMGNDTYVVDDLTDQVREKVATGGRDGVESSISYVLGTNVEILLLTGIADLAGTGNALDNELWGNTGANLLNGGTGADRMYGGFGDDTYIVQNSEDWVRERDADGGNDLVKSSVSFVLGANVERLTLSGTDAINATGNELANVLIGNAGGNQLNGGLGADSLYGGLGDDTYTVDNAGDRVSETSATGGIDLVKSSISFVLGDYLENLTLSGNGAANGTGNKLANQIWGNAGTNSLTGRAGDDTLRGYDGADTLAGGLGNDTLNGGSGADRFEFDTGPGADNVDRILGFSSVDDTIRLDRDVFAAIGLGTLSADAFASGTAAQDASDRIIFDSATGNLFYDADGSGVIAQILFATVGSATQVTFADIVVHS